MISRLKTLLGVLQQSHYDTELFWAWIKRHPRPADWDTFQDKVHVVWTAKARILFVSSITFLRCFPWALSWNLQFLRPYEWLTIKFFSFRARRRLRKIKFRAIIGITGSFGKTTTKEIVAQILGEKLGIHPVRNNLDSIQNAAIPKASRPAIDEFTNEGTISNGVHKTPENVNTLLGVAGWINRRDFKDGDILIVEMGAYRKGDIAALCSIVQPTIGILTGLNEAHRERFGSLEATASAKSELIDSLPSDGIGLWNADSPLLWGAVKARLANWKGRGIQIISYSKKGSEGIGLRCESAGESGILARISKSNSESPTERDNNIPTFLRMLECRIPLLGEHFCQGLAAAVTIGNLLGMNLEETAKGCQSIEPLPRRLAPIRAPGNRLLIDDSYNITLDGVKAALEVLGQIKRRKIGVFAGIPEGGKESEKINQELGQMIAKSFEIILLRETPIIEAILKGLWNAGFTPHLLQADEAGHGVQPAKGAGLNEKTLIRYTESKEVETILAKIARDGDCVYFSAYDWPAIYL